MKCIHNELIPRNGIFGDATFQFDGYTAVLLVRFQDESREIKRTFTFKNCRFVKLEPQFYIKRPLPGLLNELEHTGIEDGEMYRCLCEDFGYLELVSEKVIIEDTEVPEIS